MAGSKIADDAAAALMRASEEADVLGDWWLGCEHLLLGLVAEAETVAARVLSAHGVELEVARRAVARIGGAVGPRPDYQGKKHTPRATVVSRLAEVEAERLGARAPGTGHYLLALLTEGQSAALAVLLELGVNPACLRADVLSALGVPSEVRARYTRERDDYTSPVP